MPLCVRCRQVQSTCCQGNPRIILTTADVERLSAHLGQRDFLELKHYPDLSFLEAYGYDQNWSRYTVLPGDRRRQVRAKADGDCFLLSDGGCLAPREVRPLMCRLYPWDYNEQRLLGMCSRADLECPLNLREDGDTPEQIAGAPRAQLEAWRDQLYRELRDDCAWRSVLDGAALPNRRPGERHR